MGSKSRHRDIQCQEPVIAKFSPVLVLFVLFCFSQFLHGEELYRINKSCAVADLGGYTLVPYNDTSLIFL